MIDHIVDKEIFREVLETGIFASSEHFALHKLKSGEGENQRNLKVGVVVPKRWAKRAVTRNAIKRQIYIVAAELAYKHQLEKHVVRLSRAFDKKIFLSPTSKDFKKAIKKEILFLYGSTGVTNAF
jgi:ribonuclease P protein component